MDEREEHTVTLLDLEVTLVGLGEAEDIRLQHIPLRLGRLRSSEPLSKIFVRFPT